MVSALASWKSSLFSSQRLVTTAPSNSLAWSIRSSFRRIVLFRLRRDMRLLGRVAAYRSPRRQTVDHTNGGKSASRERMPVSAQEASSSLTVVWMGAYAKHDGALIPFTKSRVLRFRPGNQCFLQQTRLHARVVHYS